MKNMQKKLSIPELQRLIAERDITIERNNALLFEKNLILDNYKSQKSKVDVSHNKSTELRNLRRRVACDEAELRETESNLNALRCKLEQAKQRRGRPLGCSEARFKLLSNIVELRQRIQAGNASTELKLCELDKQKEIISKHQYHLKCLDEKLMTHHNNVDTKQVDKFSQPIVNNGNSTLKNSLFTSKPYSGATNTITPVNFNLAKQNQNSIKNNSSNIKNSVKSIVSKSNESSDKDTVDNDNNILSVNHPKSKLRNLIESTRPNANINTQDHKINVDSALSILLPNNKGQQSIGQTIGQTIGQKQPIQSSNITNTTTTNTPVPMNIEFETDSKEIHLADMLSDSVNNLTVLDCSDKEMTTNFNGDSFDLSSDSLEYANQIETNQRLNFMDSDSSTGDELECLQIISEPCNPNLKGCISKGKPQIKNSVTFDPLVMLLDASLEGELDQVMKFTKIVDNPSASNDEGITALHNAICAGHVEIMRFLINIPCNINATDSDGWMPLHCAASCNHLPMIQELVEHGAAVLYRTYNDNHIAEQKCEPYEEDFEKCSNYLLEIRNNIGVINGRIVYALFNYTAVNSDELSFSENDQIEVLEKEGQWWMGKMVKTRETGYIPSNLIGLYPIVKAPL